MKLTANSSSPPHGFTLIELLIVIVLILILATVLLLVIHPATYFQRIRESRRIHDIRNMQTAVSLILTRNLSPSLGTLNTLYISVADSDPACANLGLRSLPSGWSYHCATTSNLRKVDGTGWMPINFSSLGGGSPLTALMIDPENTTSSNHYYTYGTDGQKFQISAVFESDQFSDQAAGDGGYDPATFEVGTSVTLTPFSHGMVGYWKLDEGTGVSTADFSGYGNTGTLTGGPTWATGKVGPYAVTVSPGSSPYVGASNIAQLNGASRATIDAWMKRSNVSGECIVGEYQDSSNFLLHGEPNDGSMDLGLASGGPLSEGVVTLNDTSWHHVVMAYDGTQSGNAARMKGYVDGVQQTLTFGGTVLATIPSMPAAQFRMGNYGGRNVADCTVDNVRVYNRVLTSVEIQQMYQAGQ